MTFTELGVDTDLVAALERKNITEPFPIQQQTIPLAMTGQDIIGQAKTGTGKTLGFGLPLLQRIGTDPGPGVKALIVVPTRELATQVAQDLETAAEDRDVEVAMIYGGKSYDGQIEQLERGAQVVVGTPGRLIDLINKRILTLKGVTEMVLDEADRMLDLGFLADIEKLFSLAPENRHTQLFSATMPAPIVALARRFMTKPIHIRAADPDDSITQANIRHVIYRAHALDKDEVIARILQAEGRGKTIIFMRTKRAAAKLLEELRDRGFPAVAVHGDLNQEQRERAMKSFKAGKKDVMIATDVAARGIDVDDVTHVINHTIPDDPETYLHRAGRTGRAGKTGIAITFVDWDDLHKWTLINRTLELDQTEPVETYSSSPHLYTDLGIPEGTKGRIVAKGPEIAPSERPSGRSRNRSRNRKRTRSSGQSGSSSSSGSSGQSQGSAAESSGDGSANRPSGQNPSGSAAGNGRRRRRRRGRGRGGRSGSGAGTGGFASSHGPSESQTIPSSGPSTASE